MSPSRREREYARRRYERWAAKQQQRAAQRRRTQRNAIAIGVTVIAVLGIAIGAAVLHGTGSGSTTAAGATPSPSAPAASASATSPSAAAAGEAANPCPTPTVKPPATPESWKSAPPKTLAAGKAWNLTLSTTCGKIIVQLDGAKAPQATSSAIFLSRNGFWNGSPCHRLTGEQDGIYVLQCGDPTGTGTGGPGYSFGPVENAPKDGVYPAGTVAMARSQSTDSNGSQFFIVYKDTTLPAPGYTIMGKVKAGMDVVQRVAAGGVSTTAPPAPARPISIVSTTVTPA
ncbi:MAG TPA: peptidylprolyl isomerase [Kineosporiaceae bacterium]|nr:peptidylprolyl isomerase [Kineosporiaceae bacterium]